jgi:hypothetical protein
MAKIFCLISNFKSSSNKLSDDVYSIGEAEFDRFGVSCLSKIKLVLLFKLVESAQK